jgi:hypothetical protein
MGDASIPARVHDLLDPEVEDLIRSTIDKFKMGLEIWWAAVPDIAQMPILTPEGQPTGAVHHQPVMKIIIGARGLALGLQNFLWSFVLTDPIPQQPSLERVIIKAIEELNQQRASQLNGPSTSYPKGS